MQDQRVARFEQEVIDHVWQLGSAVVGAAGNNNSGLAHYPSAYRHVLSVANVSNFDVRNTTSNHGPTVDVSAPGTNIYSTIPGGYGLMTGTSMSSRKCLRRMFALRSAPPFFSGSGVTSTRGCLRRSSVLLSFLSRPA